jgi:hypothetical protein
MNIKKLLQHLDTFPIESDDSDWRLTFLLHPLYGETLDFWDYDNDAREAFLELDPDIVVRTVFDFEHESDESCFVKVISYQGKPFAAVNKFGDRSDVHAFVVDADVFKTLGKRLAGLLAAQKLDAELEKLNNEAARRRIDSLSQLRQGYLTWLSDEAGAFTFDSPQHVMGDGFRRAAQHYATVAQEEDGTVHVVRTLRQYEGRATGSNEPRISVETLDGRTFVTEACRVVFFLVLPDDILDEAKKLVKPRTEWALTAVLTRCQVRITQFRAGQLGGASATPVIHNAGVMSSFVAGFGDKSHEGVFSTEGRNFDKL